MKPTINAIEKLLNQYIRDDKGYDYIPLDQVDEVEELIQNTFTDCGTNRESYGKGELLTISRVNKRSIKKVTDIMFLPD